VVDFFADDPVLLVFIVIGIGAGMGTVRVKGVSLGPAAALFTGLAVGAISERFSNATGLGLLRGLGLALFTYTIGLASGPSFVAGVRHGGLRVMGLVVALCGLLAGACALVGPLFDLSPADRAGLFSGAATSTPALQAAAQAVKTGDPVVAYSLTYPSAIVAMLVVLALLLGRHLPVPHRLAPPEPPPAGEPVVNWTVHVTQAGLPVLGTLRHRYDELGFSRHRRSGDVHLPTEDTLLEPGDDIVVLGPERSVSAFCRDVGERSDDHLPLDRTALDFRRVVVSNRRLAGAHLGHLSLASRYGCTVTRVRRGDVDHVATDDFVLQLGDRVRVVGPPARLAEVARLFGDSERRLTEVDAFGFALGIAAGLALGHLPIPLPGGLRLELGAGGGPLVVGLAAGVVSRTGPITWQVAQGANLVIRQLGLLMFLACAGLGSGTTFADAVTTRHGLQLAVAGVIVASLFAAIVPFSVETLGRRNVLDTAGLFCGIETQPAALSFAVGRVADDRLNVGYALAFPVAMIAKILIVQLLV